MSSNRGPAGTLGGASPIRVGVSGTGFIGKGFTALSHTLDDIVVTAVLTKRPFESVNGVPRHLLVADSCALVDRCDVVLECSGDVLRATDVIADAFDADLPVVTMNTEFHVTTGSWFFGRGFLTEAEGDQPGTLAALAEEARSMGFKPIVYGNTKRFLNPDPTLEEMLFWSERQGISLEQVTAFTDGTKVHAEQVLIANGAGACLPAGGLRGHPVQSVRDGAEAIAASVGSSTAVADFIITEDAPKSVFVAATHHDDHSRDLTYLNLGGGPLYVLLRPYHLCYFEIAKTVRRIFPERRPPLLTNGRAPRYGLAAIAKRDLSPGDHIRRGIGSFDVRGFAVDNVSFSGHCPIGLLQNATIRRRVPKGEVVSIDDVDLPPSKALSAWLELQRTELAV
jgi:predicted homoserine dehydrogenase-like protein